MAFRFWVLLLLIAGTGCSATAASNKPTSSTVSPEPGTATPLPPSLSQAPTSTAPTSEPNTATPLAPDPFATIVSGTPPQTSGCFQTFPSVSPDRRMQVYSAGGAPLAIVLRETGTGKERRLVLQGGAEDAEAGSFVWSDNGSVLMLTLVLHPCDPTHWLYSIVRVETATLAQKTLIRNQTRVVKTVRWKAPNIVWLQDANGNTWMIDAETGASPTL